MLKDYVAYLMQHHQTVMTELDLQQAASQEARDAQRVARDPEEQRAARRARNAAEGAIVQAHSRLAAASPAVAVHYLEALGRKSDANGVRTQWQNGVLAQPEAGWMRVRDTWQLEPLIDAITVPRFQVMDLPRLSFWLSFRFTLARPLITRDDDPFTVIDNPVRKDKVFHLPFIPGPTYKGALRSAARYVVGDPPHPDAAPDHPIVERLFGTDRRRQTKDLHQGRLSCFPTFFQRTGMELINPHDRRSGAGTVPIPFETAKGQGSFHMLYMPLDLGPTAEVEVAEDIEAVAQAVQAMFLDYGLAAKKTSGYGVAEPTVQGFAWQVHHWVERVNVPVGVSEGLARQIESFITRFHLDSFPRYTNTQLDAEGWGGKRISEYKRLRREHPHWNEAAHRWETPQASQTARRLLEIEAKSLDLTTLVTLAGDQLGKVLRQENRP